MAIKSVKKSRSVRSTKSKEDSNDISQGSPRPEEIRIISFEDLQQKNPPVVRKIYIPSLGGYIWIQPADTLTLKQIANSQKLHEAGDVLSRFLSENTFKDENRTPIATYDQWMTFTPDQLMSVFQTLLTGEFEKND